MGEIEEFLQLLAANTIGPNEDRFVHSVIITVPLLIVLMLIIGTFKKKATQTTVHNRFIALHNKLIKALELEETSFLNVAAKIHEEHTALVKAYKLLHGEEQKK